MAFRLLQKLPQLRNVRRNPAAVGHPGVCPDNVHGQRTIKGCPDCCSGPGRSCWLASSGPGRLPAIRAEL
jgi:hypothetical protein